MVYLCKGEEVADLKNTLATACLKVGGAAFTMGVIIAAGTFSTPAQLGTYFYQFSIVVVLSCVMKFGFDLSILQKGWSYSDVSEIYSAGVIFATTVALFFLVIVAVIYEVFSANINPLLWVLVVFSAYFWCLVDLISALDWLKSRHVKSSFLKFFLYPVAHLALICIFSNLELEADTKLLLSLMLSLMLAFLVAFSCVSGAWVRMSRLKLSRFINYVRSSSAVLFENLLTIVTANIPVFVIAVLVGAEGNAIYGVARRVSNLMGFLSTSAVRVIAPTYNKGVDEFFKRKREVEKMIAIIIGCVFAGSLFFDGSVSLIFGIEIQRWVLPVLILSHLFSMPVITNIAYFQVSGRARLGARIALVNFILSGLVLYLLAWAGGVFGVVCGILLVAIIVYLLSSFLVRNTLAS